MDIFNLGEAILSLLEVVFGFWNSQVNMNCLDSLQHHLKAAPRGESLLELSQFLLL